MAESTRQEATHLLQHYFRTVWLKAGLKWDSDNNAEIEVLVTLLLDKK